MTPDQHGYVKCESCGCWRKPEDIDMDLNGNFCENREQCDTTFRSIVTDKYFPREVLP